MRGRFWHPHYPFNLMGLELVGVSSDTVPAHWGNSGGGLLWTVLNASLVDWLSVTADWAIYCPLDSSLHIGLLLYGNINRGCILPSLHVLLTSLPVPWCPLSPLHPSHGNKLGSQVKLLFWLLCKSPSETYSYNLAGIFSPLFLNLGLLFPWESQGHIWSSSVAAAAAWALKAKCVCVCMCVYSGYSSQQGSSSGGTQLVALQRSNLPLTPSGLLNSANSTGALSSLSQA